MGVSTDAILAYGYDLGEAEDYEDDTNIEDSNYYNKGEYMERRLLERLVGFTEEWTPESDFWKRRQEAEEKSGLEIIYHCSGEYPMYFLAIRGTEILARRGTPVRVHSLQPEIINPEWDTLLKKGMEALGIDPKGEEPGWFLFSMWG